ncbi:MAG: PD-(D/E)XK nuclease family protein [Anaplasma sp.]
MAFGRGGVEVFTIHCSESFLGVVAQYAIAQRANIIIVPDAEEVHLLCEEMLKLGCMHGVDVLAFAEIGGGVFINAHSSLLTAEAQLLLLVQFIEEWGMNHGFYYPAHMAQELLTSLNEMHVCCVEPAKLLALKDDEFSSECCRRASHFLYDLVQWWRRTLSDMGAAHACHDTDAFVQSLGLPGKRVIFAGVAFGKLFVRFLKSLTCTLPDIKIVLPYIDLSLPEHEWRALDGRHYQYFLMCLLRDLGVDRREVQQLGGARPNPAVERLFNLELGCHLAQHGSLRDSDSIELITCESEAEEAAKVAEILQSCGDPDVDVPENICRNVSAMDSPSGRCVAFVSRNSLAYRTRSLLCLEHSRKALFDYDKAISTLVLCVVEVALSSGNSVQLLHMLKHPLAGFGYGIGEYRALLSALEVEVIREHSVTGFEAIGKVVQENFRQLEAFWTKITEIIAPLVAIRDGHTVSEISAAHLQCLKVLTGESVDRGTVHRRAWERMREYFSVFDSHCMGVKVFSLRKYRDLCAVLVNSFFSIERNLLSSVNLASRDVVILSGFTESEFALPSSTLLNSWTRAKLGLPSLEENYGRLLYILYSFFYAKKLYVTRSTKTCGVATADPVWVRYLGMLLRSSASCAEACDDVESTAVEAPDVPAPNPGLEVRKKAMSLLTVKAVETLVNNPYAFYSRYVLGIYPVKQVDTEQLMKNFNEVVYKVLRAYLKCVVDEGSHDLLFEIARREFHAISAEHPYAEVMWWPKFEKMASNFFELDNKRRSMVARVETNVSFVWDVNSDMQVVAKCDRVEYLKSGGIMVVCYKVGPVPSQVNVRYGFASRPVVDAICVSENTGVNEISFAYWKIAPEKVEVTEIKDFALIVDIAKQGFRDLLLRYAESMTPFSPREDFSRFSEYELLSRIRERILHSEASVVQAACKPLL